MQNKKILIIEDDATLRDAISDTLLNVGYQVTAMPDAKAALTHLQNNAVDLIISDVQMPGINGDELLRTVRQSNFELPIILMTAYGTIEHAVAAMQNGANEYLVKPFAAEALLTTVARYLDNATDSIDTAVVSDPVSQQLYNLAAKVAGSHVSVLINGESGVGKEVLARFIHQNSSRNQQPFIAINCAAIPENMLEAVLFGYEKGAFTGAHQRTIGKFELAQNGTLLLDEISEMDLGLQAKLLRVLQEQEVERLGGRKPIALDVRVLATTNRNLRDEVAAGTFREDLFYRLNVFPLTIAPLRERRQDIIPIAEALLSKHHRRLASGTGVLPVLSDVAKQKLFDHQWPGNIREMENVIQRALVVSQSATITEQDLFLELEIQTAVADNHLAVSPILSNDLKLHEQELILQALNKGNGSRKYAAETLGISPRTLRYKLSKMREQGIQVPPVYGAVTG